MRNATLSSASIPLTDADADALSNALIAAAGRGGMDKLESGCG